MTFKRQGGTWVLQATIPAGTAKTFHLPNRGRPCAVSLVPGAGGSAALDFSLSTNADVDTGACVWEPYGTFDTPGGLDDASGTLGSIRVTATAAAAQIVLAQGAN